MKVVLDTSVLVKWFTAESEPRIKEAILILEQTKKKRIKALIPDLALHELNNTFLKKQLSQTAVEAAYQMLKSMPLTISISTNELLSLAFKLAQEYKITAYDAIFISLARKNQAILITDNPKHQGKVKEVQVIALKDFPAIWPELA